MTYYKLLGIAMTGLTGAVLLKRMKEEYSLFLSLLVSLLLTSCAIGIISPVAEYIKEIGNKSGITTYVSLIFKSCGTAIITSLASDICRDSGEAALGARIDLCGKCILIYMAFPLIKSVFEATLNILA